MSKVICNAVGSVPHLCNGCGAAKPHDKHYCEPCPVNTEAHCVEIINTSEEGDDYHICKSGN